MNKFCKRLIFIAIIIIILNIIVALMGSIFYEAQMFFEPDKFEFGFAKYRTIGRIIIEISLYLSVIIVPISIMLLLYAILKFKNARINKIISATVGVILSISLFYLVNYDYFSIYSEALKHLNHNNKQVSYTNFENDTSFINVKNYDKGSIFEYSKNPCGALIYTIDGKSPSSDIIDGHPMYWVILRLDDNDFLALKIFNCHDF